MTRRFCVLLLAAVVAAQEEDEIARGVALLGGPKHREGVAKIRGAIDKLEAHEPDAETLFRIGQGWLYVKQDQRAVGAFRRAVRAAPKVAKYHYWHGYVLMVRDPAGALPSLEKAIQLDGRQAEYRVAHGRLLHYLNHPAKALAEFLKACELDPKNAEAQALVGSAYVARGKNRNALAYFEKAMALDPENATTRYNAAQVHYLLGEFEEAHARWSEVARKNPNDFRTHVKLVQACYALERYDEAAQHRKRVLALRQKRPRFCFDQFPLGKKRVYAYEPFDSKLFLYRFEVRGTQGQVLEVINLETRAITREHGIACLLGRTAADGTHTPLAIAWKERPDYPTLKKAVIAAIERSGD